MQHINSKSASLPKRILSQFATYRNAITRVAFLTTFLVITFLASLPEVSRGQDLGCPDSTGPGPNPDSIPWVQDSAYVTIPGTACSMEIYFCYRQTDFDTLQTWLDGASIDSNTDCDSLADSTLIYEARVLLGQAVAGLFGNLLEPCYKNYYIMEEVFSPTCWSPVTMGGTGSGHGVALNPCVAYNFYCEEVCQVCWNPITREPVIQNCNPTGPDVSVSCITGAPWLPGGCYFATCFGQTYDIKSGGAPNGIESSLGVTPAPILDTSMQAFPNPASGSLTVTSAITGEPVQIIDVLGRVVMNGVISTNGSLILDVSSLSAGTYYASAGHIEVKFIKN